MIAAARHANLGDAPYQGQSAWPNRLTVGPIGEPAALVAEQKNRNFNVLDVANDGSVIYASDDAPLAKASPAPDMGLYLETSGHSVHELSEARTYQFQGARFVGDGLALVAWQIVGGDAGKVEVDLVTLCTSDNGCTATTKQVATESGQRAELIVASS
jgi:hypothetical protein